MKKSTTNNCLFCQKPITNKSFCNQKCQGQLSLQKSRQKVAAGLGTDDRRVKEYLLHIHGKQCQNPDCAWDFSAMHVNVELDHKDGNHKNNSLSNIWLLCPNCHSLTPTYRNKNKGKGRAKRRERYIEGKSF